MLGWTQSELAARAGLHKNAVVRLELGHTDPRVSTLAAVEAVLRRNGIVFLEDEGEGEGVRIKPVGK